MIKLKEDKNEDLSIDLTGPEGNAFALMGTATNLAKQLSYSEEETKALIADMRSGDYEHLIQVFDNHFGDYVTLYR